MKFLNSYWEEESYDKISDNPLIVKLKPWYEWKKKHFKWWYQYLNERDWRLNGW